MERRAEQLDINGTSALMARLPQVGGDSGSWGDVLNDYLQQSHNNDGTLKNDTVGAGQLKPKAVMASAIGDGQVTRGKLAQSLQDEIDARMVIPDDSVGTDQLKDDAVTKAKIQGAGEAGGIATLDEGGRLPATQAPERRLIRASYTNGGQSSNAGTAITGVTQRGIRLRVVLPVATKRWRLRLRNYDSFATTPSAQSNLALAGAVIGKHAFGSLLAPTWNYVAGTTKTINFSGTTIPGTGPFLESPWIEATADQLTENVEYILGVAYTAASSVTVLSGTGNCRLFTTATDALSGAISANTTVPGGVPLDVIVEYEAYTDRRIGLFIGDSNMEGVGTEGSFLASWHEAYPRLAAARGNTIANVIALAGTTSYSWGDAAMVNHARWKRVDLSTQTVDYAVISLGTNDIGASQNLGTYQSYGKLIVDKIKTEVGHDLPIILATVPGVTTWSTDQVTLQGAYNAWLRQRPLNAQGLIDIQEAFSIRGGDATFLTSDNVHLNRRGRDVIAALCPAA